MGQAQARWGDYGLALAATAAAVLCALGLARVLELPNISLVFLAAVLLVAVRSSLGPALACAGLSFLAYNFLFIAPHISVIPSVGIFVIVLAFNLLGDALRDALDPRLRI